MQERQEFRHDQRRLANVDNVARNEHFQIVEYLIEQCAADHNIARSNGWNALHAASQTNKKNTK